MTVLYVVTTNGPGPGVSALIQHQANIKAARGVVDAWIIEAASGACEFVELEDEHGRGHGPASTGADWEKQPDGKWRLGPFVSEREFEHTRQLGMQARQAADERGKILQRAVDKLRDVLGLGPIPAIAIAPVDAVLPLLDDVINMVGDLRDPASPLSEEDAINLLRETYVSKSSVREGVLVGRFDLAWLIAQAMTGVLLEDLNSDQLEYWARLRRAVEQEGDIDE